MKISRILGLTTAVTVLGLAGIAPAKADFTVTFGNTAGGDNILFNFDQNDSTQLYGILNNDNDFHVNFKSSDALHANGGQALIERATKKTDLTNLEIFLDAGVAFTQYVFVPTNFDNGETMHFIITGLAADHETVETMEFDLTENQGGSNFVTVKAINGELITNIKMSGATWSDQRQNRINGAGYITEVPPPPTVPEGSSLMMIGSGSLPLFGFIAMRRRRK
jgi:hypothetical protein